MLQTIAVFLITTLSSLYISAILLRFLLALNRADFYNPVSQFLVKITQPILKPMRRFIPPVGKIDTSSLALAFAVQFIAVTLVYLIKGFGFPFGTVMTASLAELTRNLIWIFITAMLVQAVMSWVGNSYNNLINSLLNNLTAPILNPLRKFIPLIGGIDLSPLAAIIGLQVVLIVLGGLPRI